MISIFKKRQTLEDQIHLIQSGDRQVREKIIQDYFPFVIDTLSDLLNRFIEVENDPYLSTGLQAFNDALDKYDSSKGKFISFAKVVIKNRVYDELRKNKKHDQVVYLDQNQLHELEDLSSSDLVENQEDIRLYKERLKLFNIELEDLMDESPKHLNARLSSIKAGIALAGDATMIQHLYDKKVIPRKKLMVKTGLSLKQIRHNRQFIIAVAIAIHEKLTFICEYINEVGGEISS